MGRFQELFAFIKSLNTNRLYQCDLTANEGIHIFDIITHSSMRGYIEDNWQIKYKNGNAVFYGSLTKRGRDLAM